jgi:DNA repair exonuclease SbcCD ATPase subunit
MLNSIEINSFLRIPYLKVGLQDAMVHIFCGDNEAGKSTVGEAIRFALRGVSSRVKLKGNYDQLLHLGKKTGHVVIDIDGFPIRRNIRDAKATTKAALDYPDLLVDIQLGGVEFARANEKELRAMLNVLFKVGTPDEFIRARLADRGVTDQMMNKTLPLIRASGFELAAAAASQEQTRARGLWEGITNERYGSAKAKDWEPSILSEPVSSKESLQAARKKLDELTARRDLLNQSVGAIAEQIRLQASVSKAPIETLKQNVADAEDGNTEAFANLEVAQAEYQATTTTLQNEIRGFENQLDTARQEATTLACPCCGVTLSLRTAEGTVMLVESEPGETKNDRPDLRAVTNALTNARLRLETHQRDQRQRVAGLQRTYTNTLTSLTAARSALEARRNADTQPAVTEADAEAVAAEIATLDQEVEQWRSKLQTMGEKRRARARAIKAKRRATKAAVTTAQWAIVAEALGSGPNGIPAELIASTTKPINTALAKLALPWETSPCVMGSDLSLSRADGCSYFLLSKAAQWKANAMIQLALATVSTLKLVVLDGFDVIQPSERGSFIEALIDYNQRHPDITVIAMGTLKSKPIEPIDGVKFHWIQNGQLQEAA